MIEFKHINLSYAGRPHVYVSAYVTNAGNCVKLVIDAEWKNLCVTTFSGQREVFSFTRDSIDHIEGNVTARWDDEEFEQVFDHILDERKRHLLFGCVGGER